jgi:hypothetical protein
MTTYRITNEQGTLILIDREGAWEMMSQGDEKAEPVASYDATAFLKVARKAGWTIETD